MRQLKKRSCQLCVVANRSEFEGLEFLHNLKVDELEHLIQEARMQAGLLSIIKKNLRLWNSEDLRHEFKVGNSALKVRFFPFVLHAVLSNESIYLSLFLVTTHT